MDPKPYRIAIVGSYSPTRVDELKLKNVETAPLAAEQLGKVLAARGYHIIVYASYAHLFEIDVVRGYTQVIEEKPECIEVHYSQKSGQPKFVEAKEDDPRFCYKPDRSDNWEVSFYQSIADIDGMLLMGGGPSALIAGIVAISHKKPVVVCADFGGDSRQVWEALTNQNVLATKDEVTRMANEWTANSAERMIDILEAQIKRREKQEAELAKAESDKISQALEAQIRADRQLRGHFFLGVLGLILAGATSYAFMLGDATSANPVWPLYMLGASALAGVAGANTIVVFDQRHGGKSRRLQSPLAISLFGLTAGSIAAGLFYIAQIVTSPANTSSSPTPLNLQNLVFFILIIGLIAGLTFEPALNRLRSLDVIQIGGIQAAQVPKIADE